MLSLGGAQLLEAMRAGGILAQRSSEEANELSISAYGRHFSRIVYVCFAGDSEWCTCHTHALYASCEHLLFVRCLPLTGRRATASFEDLPQPRAAGRPRHTTTVPRGARAVRHRDEAWHATRCRRGS